MILFGRFAERWQQYSSNSLNVSREQYKKDGLLDEDNNAKEDEKEVDEANKRENEMENIAASCRNEWETCKHQTEKQRRT